VAWHISERKPAGWQLYQDMSLNEWEKVVVKAAKLDHLKKRNNQHENGLICGERRNWWKSQAKISSAKTNQRRNEKYEKAETKASAKNWRNGQQAGRKTTDGSVYGVDSWRLPYIM